MKHLKIILWSIVLCTSTQGFSALTYENGRVVIAKADQAPAQEAPFKLGLAAVKFKSWQVAISQFEMVNTNFPNSQEGQTALYYLGICHYYLNELDVANEYLSEYLQSPFGRDFFESAVEYKLAIANRFSEGAKRRAFAKRYMPKVLSGEDLALQIYDEVAATLPCHEFAVWALYGKAHLQWNRYCYYESIDTFQQLIRRFPKHELAPESYLTISYIYLEQCDRELHNSDLLALAQINLRKFQTDFPRDETLSQAEANLLAMKELYARALFETGEYYVRKGHPNASLIYYQNVIDQYPETSIATRCSQQLSFYGKAPLASPAVESIPE